MKKKRSVLAALILCALVLAACSRQQQPDNAMQAGATTPVPSAVIPSKPTRPPTPTPGPILTPAGTGPPSVTPWRASDEADLPAEMSPTRPTGRTMTVYYPSGDPETVAQYEDGTWRAPNGVFYLMEIDGVLRAKGYADLYTYDPTYGQWP